MDNKKKGNAFENDVVQRFRAAGWWVHFLAPDSRGAQPFDIIAMKEGVTIVGDCKTAVTHWFPYSRLEWNQVYAFERWLACGGTEPQIFVEYNGKIKTIPYKTLRDKEKIDLDKFDEEEQREL